MTDCLKVNEESITKLKITKEDIESKQIQGAELKKSETKATLSAYCQLMVNCTTTNYNKATPSAGSSEAAFNDNLQPRCTNFISHCILAGGFHEKSGTNLSEDGWYYNSISDRSSTWASVNALYNFLTYGYSTGPIASRTLANSNDPYKYSPPPSNDWDIGDIIQIKYNYEDGYG
jgi:hypothetical protein